MKHFDKITLLVLVILNLVLKMLFLSSNSVGGDEPFSIYHAQMDVSYIIHHLLTGNNPPLYEIILHFWIKLFGISEFAVRFPSLIFSSFTVFFVYKIGITFFSRRIAIIASLLFTFSNYHLSFAHEARVYALFALLTAMSMFWFLKILKHNNDVKYYILLLATNILILYSHYFGFFVIFIQTISFSVITVNRKQLRKEYIIFLGALFVLYIPILHPLSLRFIDSVGNGTWISSPEGIKDLYIMLWKFSNMPLTTIISLTIIVAALIKLILIKDFKNISTNTKIIFIWFWVPFLFMFFISYQIPMFYDRYLIFLTLGYYLLLAICSDYLITAWGYNFIIPVILVVSYIITYNPDVDNKRHVKDAVAKIREIKDKNTVVLVCPAHFVLNFCYYYEPLIFKDVDNKYVYNKIFEQLRADNVQALNNINQVNFNNSSHILYLDAAAQFSFPDNNILIALEKNYKLNNTYKFYEIFNIYEFIKKGDSVNVQK